MKLIKQTNPRDINKFINELGESIIKYLNNRTFHSAYFIFDSYYVKSPYPQDRLYQGRIGMHIYLTPAPFQYTVPVSSRYLEITEYIYCSVSDLENIRDRIKSIMPSERLNIYISKISSRPSDNSEYTVCDGRKIYKDFNKSQNMSINLSEREIYNLRFDNRIQAITKTFQNSQGLYENIKNMLLEFKTNNNTFPQDICINEHTIKFTFTYNPKIKVEKEINMREINHLALFSGQIIAIINIIEELTNNFYTVINAPRYSNPEYWELHEKKVADPKPLEKW